MLAVAAADRGSGVIKKYVDALYRAFGHPEQRDRHAASVIAALPPQSS